MLSGGVHDRPLYLAPISQARDIVPERDFSYISKEESSSDVMDMGYQVNSSIEITIGYKGF